MEAIGLIGAAAIGAGASMYSAGQANKMSRDIAREQMHFQEIMSNTAYQRAVEDMKKAGINPMFLANGGAGASTPVGSTAQTHAADVGGDITNALTAYMDYKIKKSNDALIQETKNKTSKEIEKINAEIDAIRQNTNINKPKEAVNNTVTQWIENAKKAMKKSNEQRLDAEVKKMGVSTKGFDHYKNLPLAEKVRVYQVLRKAKNK